MGGRREDKTSARHRAVCPSERKLWWGVARVEFLVNQVDRFPGKFPEKFLLREPKIPNKLLQFCGEIWNVGECRGEFQKPNAKLYPARE